MGLGHSPDIQAGDGAADDHALDLGGALEDREVVGRTWSRAARILTISRWPAKRSVIVDGHLPLFSWLSRSRDGAGAVLV
jgi:hypothetical protein